MVEVHVGDGPNNDLRTRGSVTSGHDRVTPIISICIGAVIGCAAVASTSIGAGVAVVIAAAGRSDHREHQQGREQPRQQRSRRTRSHGFPRVVVGPPGPVSVTGATRSSTLVRKWAVVQVGLPEYPSDQRRTGFGAAQADESKTAAGRPGHHRVARAARSAGAFCEYG